MLLLLFVFVWLTLVTRRRLLPFVAAALCLVALYYVVPAGDARRLFGPVAAAVGVGIVAVLFVVHRRPVILAWYDSPMAFQFHIEAVANDGRAYEVTPATLAPYDLPLAQGRFYYLTDVPMLVNCLGSTPQWGMLRKLEAARTTEDLAAIRAVFGSQRTSAASAERFELLIQRFFRHQRTPRATSWMSRLPSPPQHIWTAPHRSDGQVTYDGQDTIQSVRIRLREALAHDRQLHVVRDEVVRTFPLTENNLP